MAIRDSGASLALLFGRATDLADSITAAIRRDGIPLAREQPLRSDHMGSQTPGAGASRAVDAAIVIIDALATDAFTGGSWAARRQRRVCAHDTCAWAVTAALDRGADRVALICDARTLSFGERLRAIRWLRDVARRIAYECAINGRHGLVTAYGVVDTDLDGDRVADAVAAWLRSGESSERPRAPTGAGVLWAA